MKTFSSLCLSRPLPFSLFLSPLTFYFPNSLSLSLSLSLPLLLSLYFSLSLISVLIISCLLGTSLSKHTVAFLPAPATFSAHFSICSEDLILDFLLCLRSHTRETQSEVPQYRFSPQNKPRTISCPAPKVFMRKFLNIQRTSSENLGEPKNGRTKLDMEQKHQEISSKL